MVIDPRVTVVTLTKGDRPTMLQECIWSVRDQLVHPRCHHIELDEGAGFSATANLAVQCVQTEFFNFVDDDDLILPNHLQVMGEALDANPTVDIVHTFCEVKGRDITFNEPYQPGLVQLRPYIPSNLMMRTSLFRQLGGYGEMFNPDWDFMKRAETYGAVFLTVPVITWVYRFHGSNMSVPNVA